MIGVLIAALIILIIIVGAVLLAIILNKDNKIIIGINEGDIDAVNFEKGLFKITTTIYMSDHYLIKFIQNAWVIYKPCFDDEFYTICGYYSTLKKAMDYVVELENK